MRHCYLLLLLLLAGGRPGAAQSTLLFSVRQAPPLLVDAGLDKVIRPGEKVTLGGTSPATGGSGTYTYAWTPPAGLDRADIAKPVASPAVTTRYQLTVQDPTGCSKQAQVTVTVNTVTAVRASQDPLGLYLFPNPNQGKFTLASERLSVPGLLTLEVYNPLGQRIYHEAIQAGGQKLGHPVQLPQQAHGIYLLLLTGKGVYRTFTLQVE